MYSNTNNELFLLVASVRRNDKLVAATDKEIDTCLMNYFRFLRPKTAQAKPEPPPATLPQTEQCHPIDQSEDGSSKQ